MVDNDYEPSEGTPGNEIRADVDQPMVVESFASDRCLIDTLRKFSAGIYYFDPIESAMLRTATSHRVYSSFVKQRLFLGEKNNFQAWATLQLFEHKPPIVRFVVQNTSDGVAEQTKSLDDLPFDPPLDKIANESKRSSWDAIRFAIRYLFFLRGHAPSTFNANVVDFSPLERAMNSLSRHYGLSQAPRIPNMTAPSRIIPFTALTLIPTGGPSKKHRNNQRPLQLQLQSQAQSESRAAVQSRPRFNIARASYTQPLSRTAATRSSTRASTTESFHIAESPVIAGPSNSGAHRSTATLVDSSPGPDNEETTERMTRHPRNANGRRPAPTDPHDEIALPIGRGFKRRKEQARKSIDELEKTLAGIEEEERAQRAKLLELVAEKTPEEIVDLLSAGGLMG